VRDRETKRRLGEIFDELGRARGWAPERTPWEEVPVLIAVCSEGSFGTSAAGMTAMDASIFPAVQNMLLAARALGLGATLTTRHLLYEKETEAALGLPPGVHSYAILPIGYPMGRFGPVGRAPLADIVYQDRWGEPYSPR